MNRFKIRLPALAVLASTGVLAATLTGCGAGQISQMATQEPAVNGNRATFNNVALRDVHIRASQSGDFIEPGKTVDLVLVAINQSPDITDRLVGITSDIGTVTLAGGDGRLPAGGMLFIGTPDGKKVAPGADGRQQRGQGDRDVGPAHHQWPHLQLHLQLREGRAGDRDGADFGLGGSAAVLTAHPTACHAGVVAPGRYGQRVANARSQYRCSECRHLTAKWVGRCMECGTWGTVDEVAVLSAVGGGAGVPRIWVRHRKPFRSVPSSRISASTARRGSTS